MYLVGDPEVNAFAADGQNIFVMSGIILYCKNPNELIGVMAHEPAISPPVISRARRWASSMR